MSGLSSEPPPAPPAEAASPGPAQRVVVGTAGHIDHGKTRLLEALTGVDCDRWAEEKARGITIDLGFTHLQEGDLQIGFVDVPGHEKFLHNALAGLGGIRLVLLVVAADEGVKPQTREHLDICTLLEIPHAIVALTKTDLVDDDLRDLAQLEVEELLEATPFAGSSIVPVSSLDGSGIAELRLAISDMARELAIAPDPERPVRLPIDRAFQLKGLGAIVTGTLVAGRIEAGQTLEVLPRGSTARVRSVQVHGSNRPRAEAGERSALQLVGIDLADLARGEHLGTPEIFAQSRSLAARVRLLPTAPGPARGWLPIRFHIHAAETTGKMRPMGGELAPGDEGIVEIRLAKPVVGVRGDAFVVRRPSPPLTLGGGTLLDPQWRRRRASEAEKAAPLLRDLDTAIDLWVAEAAEKGLAPADLVARLGLRAAAITQLLDPRVAEARLIRVPAGQSSRYVEPKVFDLLRDRARHLLKEYFRDNRLAGGMPKAEFLGRLLPTRAQGMAEVYLRFLTAEKVAIVRGDLVNPPGRKAAQQMTGEESELSSRLLEAVEAEGLTPPSPAELARRLGTKPQILEGLQKYLVQQKKLVRLSSGLLLSTAAIETLGQEILDSGWDRFSVPEFKDRFGLSRKWAIPLLEHLDSIGVTRRLANERQVVRRA